MSKVRSRSCDSWQEIQTKYHAAFKQYLLILNDHESPIVVIYIRDRVLYSLQIEMIYPLLLNIKRTDIFNCKLLSQAPVLGREPYNEIINFWKEVVYKSSNTTKSQRNDHHAYM